MYKRQRLKSDILVCAVERSGGVIIPNGNFVLQNGDQVTFLATQDKAHEFFQRIHLPVRPVRNAFIVGGGAIAFYPVSYTHLARKVESAMFARLLNTAKNMAAPKMLKGFHWPKIITAMARKPAPATPTSKFQVCTGGTM